MTNHKFTINSYQNNGKRVYRIVSTEFETKTEPLQIIHKINQNKQIVQKLIEQIEHFKQLYNEYDEKNDKQSMHESHLIWYYLFGCLGKHAKMVITTTKKHLR